MVNFRKRISVSSKKSIKKWFKMPEKEEGSEKKSERESGKANKGKLLLDATVGPADIKYPTDVGLLNEVRKTTEKIIDILYDSLKGKLKKKPITYRKKAREDYLAIATKNIEKRKKKSSKEAIAIY